jgi:hypothetical protein
MARASVEVPSVLATAVRDSVVLLYQAAAEALHFSVRAHLEDVEPREEVASCRERLTALDGMLAQLGWWSGETPAGQVRVSAASDVLHDALYGALIDAGERLAAACGDGWEAGDHRVRTAAMEVIALDGLIGTVQR